jgi:riboflavin kinase/FMN adenylyltransferase
MICISYDESNAPRDNKRITPGGAAIALGNFDGLHLGHMRLVGVLTRRAAELGLASVIYTFRRHPKNVLDGEKSVKILTDGHMKRTLLSRTALDILFFELFDREFAEYLPGEFIECVLAKKFGVRLIVVGSGFRFGRRGAGDIETLRTHGQKLGYSVEEVDPLTARLDENGKIAEGQHISSSAIRGLLSSGRVDKASQLLGRLYSVSLRRAQSSSDPYRAYRVCSRSGEHMAVPGAGVYTVKAGHDGSIHRGLCEINADSSVRVCLPRFNGDLQDAEIEVFFYVKIRDGAGVGAYGGSRGAFTRDCDIAAMDDFFGGGERND